MTERTLLIDNYKFVANRWEKSGVVPLPPNSCSVTVVALSDETRPARLNLVVEHGPWGAWGPWKVRESVAR